MNISIYLIDENIYISAKRDIVLESQLPQGMSGEKLKDLEQGHVTEVVQEEKPKNPPKFLYEVSYFLEPCFIIISRYLLCRFDFTLDHIYNCRRI